MQRIDENESEMLHEANPQANNPSRPTPDHSARTSSTIVMEDSSFTKSTVGNITDVTDVHEHKVLGIKWNHKNDTLCLNFEGVLGSANTTNPTKRNVVSASSRIYDPLGILSPVTIRMKMLFQEICKRNLPWDEELPEDLRQAWQHLVTEMRKIDSFVIPRYYFSGIEDPIVSSCLEGFCDASIRAYAAVVYLKTTTPTGTNATIIASKTRVSPIDERQTIPRLELLPALILARLMKTVQQALEPTIELGEPTCWTDSKVALGWIRNDEREWKQFVQNRVNEIRSLVPPEFWKHCPGKENPADIPSRGITPVELRDYQQWFNGPQWIVRENELYELVTELENIPGECLKEAKRECPIEPLTTTFAGVHPVWNIESIIELSSFSKYNKLLRVTSLVLKAVNVFKYTVDKQGAKPSAVIYAEDLREAESLWLRAMQRNLQLEARFKSWEGLFGLYKDEGGIIRCKGRIERADIPKVTSHPILLNIKHHLTELIIQECHQRVQHGGVKETLTEVRAKFWLVRGRQNVRKLIRKCVSCRKVVGRPYQAPAPPPLPEFRVQRTQPFSFVGVDFAGPLFIKQSNRNEERMIKTWISLYTCCSTRAVHLDLVPDMSSEAFIRNFRRFVARRGTPHKVISDNAKTFVSSAKKLSALFEIPEVTNHLTTKGIEWSFNLQKAPWWGGFFERLIGSAKRCLKKILGNARLTYEELLTFVVEVEATLNSRPLTYVSTEELDEPLAPSHLIYGRRMLSLPNSTIQEIDPDWSMTKKDATRSMNHLNRLLDHFWKRWRNEFLLGLRESHRQGTKNPTLRRIAKGDIVLIHDDNQRRCNWRLGKVDSLIPGKDGEIRGAEVTVSSSGLRPTRLRRPVQKLYPLEVNGLGDSDVAATRNPVTKGTTEQKKVSETRPKRAAAADADARRRQWIEDGSIE